MNKGSSKNLENNFSFNISWQDHLIEVSVIVFPFICY